ncbi:MAG: translation initiation factor IF-2 subunit gamma [Candidatus Bathyarchaeota archaeon]|nr:MAG: translation initiation factor IF-2 subunit gamma [Candidatus Bathyarchaeota archaeon]
MLSVSTKKKQQPNPLRQPEINIGTIGHVDHGKTTLVQALTGVWAAKHSEELRRGITIKLGYADAAIYRCSQCDAPECYSTTQTCTTCQGECEFLRAISFVDAPGHEALMATMISGAAVMDGAILVIAADEHCPQPQTREHLAAIQITGVKKIIVVQNKIDIVDEPRIRRSYDEITAFLKETVAKDAPIIPISAQHSVNVDVLTQTMEEYLPTPERDPNKIPLMYVVRSFDVNKPGTQIQDLAGGVVGGSLMQGRFRVDDEIEIRPGIRMEKHGQPYYEPLLSEIVSLQAGKMNVEEVQCGGLIGIGTLLDPSLTKADSLTGNLVGLPGKLPPSVSDLTVETHFLERAVGTKEMTEISKVRVKENLLLDVGTAITAGTVTSVKGEDATVKLVRPVCVEKGMRTALSRKIAGRWRLIGYGVIQ